MAKALKKEFNDEHPNLKARVLPHNNEAEQAVLSCVMIDRDAPIHILAEIKTDDFYSKAHKDIYAAMLSISAKDIPIDIVTLVQELESLGMMESAGGLTYLTRLTNIVPSAANYKHYCDIVKKNSQLRNLIDASQKIINISFTGDPDDVAMATAEREIYALAEKQDRSSLREIQPSIAAAISKMELLYRDPLAGRGIPTGYKGLNAILNGFQQSDLILIAGRPGQGKTSISMNFIEHAALHAERKTAAGKPDPYKCAVFSLEMPAVQLAKRMVCSEAHVDMSRANSGKLLPEDWKRIFDAKARLDKAKIFIDDSSLTTPIEILSKCRRLKREQGLDLVMIDYLQLMSSGKRVESRQQEISDITRTMKIAAKELSVPILLLSQMSRDVEKRTNKTPQMSDLRESGAIEQDADIIIFIYREHEPNDESIDIETRNKVQLIISKHRNGETGKVDLKWDGATVRFVDIDSTKATASMANNMPPISGNGNFDEFDAQNSGANQRESGGVYINDLPVEQIMKVDGDDADSPF